MCVCVFIKLKSKYSKVIFFWKQTINKSNKFVAKIKKIKKPIQTEKLLVNAISKNNDDDHHDH